MKILIIRFSSLGDIVLSTAVVEALFNSNCEIGFLTKADYSPLFSDDPRISAICEFSGIIDAIRFIKRFRPNYIIDLHNNQRSRIITILSCITTFRTRKRTIERRLLVSAKMGSRSPRSIVDIHLQTLSKIGIHAKDILPRIFVSNKGREYAREFLKRLRKPFAILHPGAKHPLKNWGFSNFWGLAKMFSQQGFTAIFPCSGETMNEIYFTGDIGLEQLVGVISTGDIFVGNDSGPTHIAAALGIPTLSIFGPTHPALGFVPKGKNVDFITDDIDCSPCSIHGEGKCKFKTRRCFENITPDRVFIKAMEIFQKSTSSKEQQ